VLVIGARPPHPARREASKALVCPRHYDWEELFLEARWNQHVRFLAVIGPAAEQPPRTPALLDRIDAAWRQLGEAGRFALATATPEAVVAAVGLPMTTDHERLPLVLRASH